jgi:hypothetical protein
VGRAQPTTGKSRGARRPALRCGKKKWNRVKAQCPSSPPLMPNLKRLVMKAKSKAVMEPIQ